MAKKNAGRRSGLRRSAKRALVVKKKWLVLILAGRKTWEIRGSSTSKRGWIHFAESQAGGKLTGRARLVNCFPVPRSSFQCHYKKHCVPSLSMVPYITPHAWVLEDAEKFERPFEYEHKQGAVIWVDVKNLNDVLRNCVGMKWHGGYSIRKQKNIIWILPLKSTRPTNNLVSRTLKSS